MMAVSTGFCAFLTVAVNAFAAYSNLPSAEILADVDGKVDFERLEQVLMEEGLKKFADPQKALLELIATKRKALEDVSVS